MIWYDKNLNKYKSKVEPSILEDKMDKSSHPYGWVHWYCDYYMGKKF